MAQTPTSGTPMNDLKAVLDKAKQDEGFRDKLLSSPSEALKAKGLNLDQKWIDLIQKLTRQNFESELEKAIAKDLGEGGEV